MTATPATQASILAKPTRESPDKQGRGIRVIS